MAESRGRLVVVPPVRWPAWWPAVDEHERARRVVMREGGAAGEPARGAWTVRASKNSTACYLRMWNPFTWARRESTDAAEVLAAVVATIEEDVA